MGWCYLLNGLLSPAVIVQYLLRAVVVLIAIPFHESAHALAGAIEVGRELGPQALLLVCLSGRGDKDMHTAAAWFGLVEDGKK